MMQELSIIVNEDDEIIWYKPRREIQSEELYRVSCLWITNSQGDVLLAQRGFLKSNNPGMWWSAVAGTVDQGETYEDNIYKETEEEIGLCGEKLTEWKKVRHFWQHNFFCQWYTLKIDKDIWEFVKEEWQVESIRWFSPAEVRNLVEKSPGIFTRSTLDMLKWNI